jgi:glutathione S-transferase
MTTYKLTYFDISGGRGEPIRIAFHAGGIPFEDNRLSGAEFAAMRENTRFRYLPVLEIDGAAITQSNAMCRYVGRLAGLYPEDDLQALYCDEVLEVVEDDSHRIGQTFGLEGDAMKKAREKLIDGWTTTFLRGLSQLLARGGGQYFADQRLTVADLKVLMEVRWISSGMLDYVPKDIVRNIAPDIADHAARIADEPVVKAWYASRK